MPILVPVFIWGLSNFHPVIIQVFSLLLSFKYGRLYYQNVDFHQGFFFIWESVEKGKVKHGDLFAFIDLVIFKSCEEKISDWIINVAYLKKDFYVKILFSIYYLERIIKRL